MKEVSTVEGEGATASRVILAPLRDGVDGANVMRNVEVAIDKGNVIT